MEPGLAAPGAWRGGSLGSAAWESLGAVVAQGRFSCMAVGAEQEIPPLWVVAVQCKLLGHPDGVSVLQVSMREAFPTQICH